MTVPKPGLPAADAGNEENGEDHEADCVAPGEARHALGPEILIDLVENIDHVSLQPPLAVCAPAKSGRKRGRTIAAA